MEKEVWVELEEAVPPVLSKLNQTGEDDRDMSEEAERSLEELDAQAEQMVDEGKAATVEEAMEVVLADAEKDADKGERSWLRAERDGDFDPIEHPDRVPLEDLSAKSKLQGLLNRFSTSVKRREFETARSAWIEIRELTNDLDDQELSDDCDEIESLVDDLADVVPVLFYSRPVTRRDIEVPKLILHLTTLLAHRIADSPSLLYSLTSREFEEFIADIFASFGYVVELTAQTHDGGKDIIAVRNSNDRLDKLIIECKKFKRDHPVGVRYVRELYGVKKLDKATKAILATTSYFTRDAKRIEEQVISELELKDFNAVTQWAKKYSAMLKNIRTGQPFR